MILYHGSNMSFKVPLVSKCSPHKDFGQGFYLSDSYDVARRTARRTVRQHGGVAKVMAFEADEKQLKKLSYKRFAQPSNRAWAKLTTQYSFHTQRSLALLTYKGVRNV